METVNIQEIAEHAESIKNDEHHEITVMDPGDMWCQGDVGLIYLGLSIGEGAPDFSQLEWVNEPRAQLAPGDTQGSRHCVDEAYMPRCLFYEQRSNRRTMCDGPRIDAPEGIRVNHPEHGDVTLPPGRYAVIYQQVWQDRQAARAQD